MPRRPLGPITPNVIRRKELTSNLRGIIVGQRTCGASYGAISKALNLPRSTVSTVCTNANIQIDGVSNKRSGKPKCTTVRDERYILRLA